MIKVLFKMCLTVCLLSILNNSLHAEDIILAADRWCPFNCEPGSANPGILVEIAERAFKKSKFYAEGDKFIYKDMPWARAIEEARRGQIDGIIGASKDDAPDFIFPDKSLISTVNKFYTLADNRIDSLAISSLQNLTLGAIRDYAYIDELNQYIKLNTHNSKRVQLSSGDDPLGINIRKLLAKRIDVLVEDESVMNYTLHKLKLKNQIKSLNSDLTSDVLYVAFAPSKARSKELANLVSKEMESLEHSPELKQILNKYGM